MEATAKDLRFRVKELLNAVARGEEITITYRGKPRAKLVPYTQGDSKAERGEQDALFGLWADREDVQDVEVYVRAQRKSRF
jgi:prevent-host-death family protein